MDNTPRGLLLRNFIVKLVTLESIVMKDEPDIPLRVAEDLAEAEEWTLVLVAEGLSPAVRHTSHGFALVVPASEAEAAATALAAYETENPPVLQVEDEPHGTGHLITGFTVAGVLLAFFFITGEPNPGNLWFKRGSSDAAYLLSGELWRSVTALTLHVDLGHALSNAIAMALFLSAVCRSLGPGLGSAMVLLAGAGGNLANALLQGPAHVSVGASTSVFAAVGLIVSLGVARRRRRGFYGRRAWLPIAAGFALLAMLGTGQYRVDLWAHLLGLLTGSLLGAAVAIYFHRAPGPRVQWTLAGASLAFVIGCWVLALRY